MGGTYRVYGLQYIRATNSKFVNSGRFFNINTARAYVFLVR
jgi:hypothetical protein